MALIQNTTAIPKAVAKLIDTVRNQIGLFLEPTHIRRKGQAEAGVKVSEARAKADVAVLRIENKLAIQDIQERAAERVHILEEKRQKNLEAIASQASHELPADVSDVPVDEDWVAQFFDHCKDVSNEKMQTVWSKLLAGEVTKPGSYSLRTLAAVRVLSKEDADLFTRFCTTVWQTPSGLTPIIPAFEKLEMFPAVNLSFIDLLKLDTLGVIRFETVTGYTLKFLADPCLSWHYYSKLHILSKKDVRALEIGKTILTDIGKELAIIAGSTPDEQYRNWVVTDLREKGWEVQEVDPNPTSGHSGA